MVTQNWGDFRLLWIVAGLAVPRLGSHSGSRGNLEIAIEPESTPGGENKAR